MIVDAQTWVAALVARRVVPLSPSRADVAGSPAYGCRSPSGLDEFRAGGGGRQSNAAKRSSALYGATAGHPAGALSRCASR
jgi:hypothetical protein